MNECYYLEQSRMAREKEEDLTPYEDSGCYDCDGFNTNCLNYLPEEQSLIIQALGSGKLEDAIIRHNMEVDNG